MKVDISLCSHLLRFDVFYAHLAERILKMCCLLLMTWKWNFWFFAQDNLCSACHVPTKSALKNTFHQAIAFSNESTQNDALFTVYRDASPCDIQTWKEMKRNPTHFSHFTDDPLRYGKDRDKKLETMKNLTKNLNESYILRVEITLFGERYFNERSRKRPPHLGAVNNTSSFHYWRTIIQLYK